MLKSFIEYSPAIVLLQVIIAAAACALSFKKRRQPLRSLVAFISAYALADFIFLMILPLPLKFEGARPGFEFASQFEEFNFALFYTYFSDNLARDGRYLTVPFCMSFFCPVLMPKLRKPLGGLCLLIFSEAFYLSANIIINTVSRRVMTFISVGHVLFIAASVCIGWALSMLIAKAFPGILKAVGEGES